MLNFKRQAEKLDFKNLAVLRKQGPQTLMTAIPFLLFFPVGVMYAGLSLLMLSWLVGGDFRGRWKTVSKSDLFRPVLVILGVITFNILFLSQENERRWSALVHYLIFFFLLLFISLGGGKWQTRAKKVFFIGALYGASIYYLTHLGVMPEWKIFKNYAIYSGNKSIALGIFMSIAAAWILNDALAKPDFRRTWTGIAAFVYIALAVLFLATTRTGMLLFFVLSLLVAVRHITLSLRGLALALSVLLVAGLAWQFSPHLRERTLVTVQAVQAFSKGEMGTGQSNRLQFVKKTGEMILEKPWLGHGVGSWLAQYPVRAKGLETSQMSTPHNDYLLYAAELGVIGLLALLGVFGSIFWAAWNTGGVRGMQLLVIGSAFFIGCAFNAILRDWKFGLPMMILLALALTDGKRDAYSDDSQ
jgi:O-antigen ligase